ncbi:hypothetical protein [Trichloromonas sp.]|uniref:hypothetical protein n=1 Tax=Trichloromonas sp. TaxID=3069249 RepID=UPI002A4C629E|nr:hypothetical protein [Trichloromonas sp.]
MKLKKYKEIFEEADIKDALDDEYLKNVERKARQQYGYGPSRQEMMEAMDLINKISRIQRGHEKELEEIGINVLKKHYPILNDIELDVKIVNPDDEEKMEMAQKMMDDDQEEMNFDGNEDYGPDAPQDEINKRKIINNLMQGESQNVHPMLFDCKEEVDKISTELINLHMRHLEINKKFDWFDQVSLEEMMEQAPQMVNAMETDYEEDEETGDTKPKIKARVLDLVMLIHEVVKGIYELIAAKAIPEDSVMANKILSKTDSLKDEQQDIRYGPYIAADLRNYLNEHFEKIMIGYQGDNVKELIYGELVMLPASEFIDVIKGMLSNDTTVTLRKIKKIVDDVVNEIDNYYKKSTMSEFEYEDDEDILDLPVKEEPKKELTDKDYKNMGQNELNYQLNLAIDNGDFELAKKISEFIKD